MRTKLDYTSMSNELARVAGKASGPFSVLSPSSSCDVATQESSPFFCSCGAGLSAYSYRASSPSHCNPSDPSCGISARTPSSKGLSGHLLFGFPFSSLSSLSLPPSLPAVLRSPPLCTLQTPIPALVSPRLPPLVPFPPRRPLPRVPFTARPSPPPRFVRVHAALPPSPSRGGRRTSSPFSRCSSCTDPRRTERSSPLRPQSLGNRVLPFPSFVRFLLLPPFLALSSDPRQPLQRTSPILSLLPHPTIAKNGLRSIFHRRRGGATGFAKQAH